MLPLDEWLPQAEELALGRRRRVNHVCGGGRTMLVENKPDGYSAWCHRCSEKGWHPHPQPSLAERIARLSAKREEDTTAEQRVSPPVPTTFNPQEWPLYARVWLYKAGFSNDAIMAHGFYYSRALDRVVLPVIAGGSVVYWQARGFDPDRPKYLNPVIDKPRAYYGNGGVLVLTEDILSAARVGDTGRYRGCGVLGTSLSDGAVAEVLREAAHGVALWFDPDQAGRNALAKIGAQLRLAGLSPLVIRSERDPKLYTNHEIEEFISSAST